MALHSNPTDITLESVEEFIEAASLLVSHEKPDRGMMGYAATALLLSVVDAIGHALNAPGGHTRLAVLKHHPFNQPLSDDQINLLIKHFRNPLLHATAASLGVFLVADRAGGPFELTGERLKIRVPALLDLVRNSWPQVSKTGFDSLKNSPKHRAYSAAPLSPSDPLHTSVPPASGVHRP